LFSVPPVLRLNEGKPLDWRIRRRLEKSFGRNLRSVRVHRGHRAATAAHRLGAEAFAFGPNIVLGARARPDDLGLMAHEAAHTIQQGGAPALQRLGLGPISPDAHEREAQQAGAAVLSGQRFRVSGRTGPGIQRIGIRDALDYFARVAGNLPGFAILAYVIGFNPITMREVSRNATNLFRAIIGFLPAGNLVFEALQRHGIIERVGSWVEGQLGTLGMGVRSFREALEAFLGSLGWRDIFNLGGVWERAQRIFTRPIERLTGFVRGLAGGILGLIRNAILRPVARLAQGTRGYDLLRLVLAQDPITGDPYPRTAENMIGGFMRLIGEEEKWRHLRESRAIPRAWAWFQGQLGTLMGFVREIPQLFSRLWQGLHISDLLDIGGAFNRARGIFGGFVGRFITWAGQAALQVMMFIFEALAPRAMPVLRRAASVLGTIVREPVRFVGNLVRAGLRGFQQFRTNIRQHLLNGLVGWLTGALTNAGLQLPTRWDARGILSLALQILGLTWQNIRTKLVRVVGETTVRTLETTFDIVMTLVREGPAAAWQRILEHLQNLREMVFDQIRAWVTNTIVGQAVVRILSMLNPAGAVIQAIIAIYDTIIFFRDRLQQIRQVAESFFNSIAEIAAGNIGAAANRVEQTMGRLVPVVIGFLAQLIGLGGISGTIRDVIARLRAPIDRALDRLVDWIVAQARQLGRAVAQAGVPQDPHERLRLVLTTGAAAIRRLPGSRVGRAVVNALLPAIRVRYGLTALEAEVREGTWWLNAAINPRSSLNSGKAMASAEETGPDRTKAAVAAEVRRLPRIMESPEAITGALREIFARHEPHGLQRLFFRPARNGFDLLAEASAAAFTQHLIGLTTDGAGGCSIVVQVDGRVIRTEEGIAMVVWNAGRGGPHAEARLHSNLPVLRDSLAQSSNLIEIWIKYSPCQDRCRFVLGSIEREIRQTHPLVRFRWYYEQLWVHGRQTRQIARAVVRELYDEDGIVILSRAQALAAEEIRSRRR
jgi:hypothetical protein